MIEPVSYRLNNKTTARLEPVEVPHFTGAARRIPSNFKYSPDVKARYNAVSVVNSAKKGAKEGIQVIKTTFNACKEFVTTFVTSLRDDATGMIKEKGTKIVTNIDGII